MFRNSVATGMNLRGTVDIIANSVSLVDQNEINEIRTLFIDNSRVKTATENNKVFEFNDSDINDANIPGLQSIIKYCKSHFNKSTPGIFLDESNIYQQLKINNSKKNYYFIEDVVNNYYYRKPIAKGLSSVISNTNNYYSFDDAINYNTKVNNKKTNNFYTLEDQSVLNFNKKHEQNHNTKNYYYEDNSSLHKHNNVVNKTSINNNYEENATYTI
jgi:hypothetical protein